MTDSISGTIRIRRTKFLLTSDLLVVRIPEKSVRADAIGSVAVSLADGVAAADDGAFADVLAFALAEAGVLGRAGLLD